MKTEFYSHLPNQSVQIRKEVFVLEQGFTKEFDEKDAKSLHVLVFLDENAVATCRIVLGDVVTIGRIAVKKAYRKYGIGAYMIEACLQKLRSLGINRAVIHAQEQAVGFYQKCGFHLVGDESCEDGVKHVKMSIEL